MDPDEHDEASSAASAPPVPNPWDAPRYLARPRGDGPIVGGMVLMGLGLVLCLLNLLPEVRDYRGEIDLESAATRAWFGLAGGALFGVGLPCYLTGLIIRAMWFLPGAEKKNEAGEPGGNTNG
jgi:hypothetical protein